MGWNLIEARQVVGLSLTGDQVRINEGLRDEVIGDQHDVITRFGGCVAFVVYMSFPCQH